MEVRLKDKQVWRTRGGDLVVLSEIRENVFRSTNPRTGDTWVYSNGPSGFAGEQERQTLMSKSTEDLMELVYNPPGHWITSAQG